jgi:geranylgeranyl reductase family protein
MESCNVLIVGGGPAGSSCAWKLTGAGLDVIVLDKSNFPRDKVCGGWITPAVVEELQLDVGDYRQGRTFQPITGFHIGLLNRPAVETHYDRAISYGIRRCEFDHYLLQRSSARLRLGTPFKSAKRSERGWIVNDSIETPLIVGAGGHFCPVARLLGAQLGSTEPAIAAQEIEFEMDEAQAASCGVLPEVPELHFCEDLQGYGWCFRKGNFLNVGLGRLDNRKLSEHVADFRQFLIRKRSIASDAPHKFRGHAYLSYQDSPRKRVGDGVLLMGDAAGLAYPQSGEGIRPAIESAMMAAEVIVAAMGDYSAQALEPYQTRLSNRFGERQRIGRLSDWIPGQLKRRLAGKLLSTHWFTRRVVMDRWFLHDTEPPLISTSITFQQPIRIGAD